VAIERRFSFILGVDLGGGRGKKTALAVLRPDERGCALVVDVAPASGASPFYDRALIRAVRAHPDDTLLCVDAPLTLPPCLRCQVGVCPGQRDCVDPAVVAMGGMVPAMSGGRDARRGKPGFTPYTQRVTEVYLAQVTGIWFRETLGQSTGPLAARAAHVVRALADRFQLNRNLIEVYPKGTLHSLGFRRPYKKHLRERETRAEILHALSPELGFAPGVWREQCIQSDHIFEAVIAAYTGFLWGRDAWELPNAVASIVARDGWIWIPPATLDATAAQSARVAGG